MFDVADMPPSQSDDTPCTLLYDINGQKVAVGKATIVKPKDHMFHNREMPDGVFKVNVASVLEGFEDLPPPVPVNDNETPYDWRMQELVLALAEVSSSSQGA